jgi:hypothetical protein
MATAPTRERHGLDLIRSASRWTPGDTPRELAADQLASAAAIRWIDLDGELCVGRVAEAAKLLHPSCPGITEEMISDLITPDAHPEGKRYRDGGIRIASSFSVEGRRDTPRAERGISKGAGELVFRPVELLAGEGWLVTCWHSGRTFRGATRTKGAPPGSPSDVLEAVTQEWRGRSCETAGDLGVLVMYELALTYDPAQREIYDWLEDWELSLYTEAGYDPDVLPQLWGSMAVLRDWVSPLNRMGLDTDIDKAWLPVTDHDAAIRVDDRINRALRGLRLLGETLRSSFQVLHSQQAQEDRDRSDMLQRRIAIVATAFLIPTLIVGFYGANTWVPGEGRHWGFWVMVAAIVILSTTGVGIVLRWQHQQGAGARRAARERERVRASLVRDERAARLPPT